VNTGIAILFVPTLACVLMPAYLAAELARNPAHRGIALFLFGCAGAFMWLLLVDSYALWQGALGVSTRATVFRALMVGNFAVLWSSVIQYRRVR